MSKNSLKKLSDETLEVVAERFRALSEVSRLRIVQALMCKELNVGELVNLTGLSQPNVSRHLQVLLRVKLIARRKDGLNVLYRVADEHLGDLCSLVCKGMSC